VKWRPGLRLYAALLALPLVVVALLSLPLATRSRRAFENVRSTLATLALYGSAAETVRRGVNDQLLAASRYLSFGTQDAWEEFTRLTFALHEDEARLLALPLTAEERVAVERVRLDHRLFEAIAQGAMVRRNQGQRLEDFPQMQAAFSRTHEALDQISQLIRERLASATLQANRASSRIGTAATILALLLGVALILSATLAFRGVVKPLEDLRRATGRLRGGDLSARAPVRGVRAVAQLASRFNETAVEMESLLQRLEQRVEARTAQLAALESLSRAGLTQLDRNALLRIVVERMSSAAAADAADLRLREEGLLVSVARMGLLDELDETLPEDAASARVLASQRAHWTEQLGGDPEAERLLGLGFRSRVTLPLVVRERARGMACLYFRAPRARDPELLRVLEAMAARAALALERAEMVQEVLRHAEDLQAANQRLIETQERLIEAERLAAVAQIHITLRHEINNPLSVLVGAAEILRHCPDDPEVVREWAGCLRQATDRIVDVMRRLEGLRRVETTDYVEGITMVDLRNKS
jgi:hypothetical protein